MKGTRNTEGTSARKYITLEEKRAGARALYSSRGTHPSPPSLCLSIAVISNRAVLYVNAFTGEMLRDITRPPDTVFLLRVSYVQKSVIPELIIQLLPELVILATLPGSFERM